MHFYKKIFFVLILFITEPLRSVTVVYNMRISEITKRQQLGSLTKMHNIISETAFGQFRKLGNGSSQRAFAGLTTYLYLQKKIYLKIDGAIGHVHNDVKTLVINRRQTDDLLFTGGFGHNLGTYGRIGYSALLGVPTHRDFILDLAQFGTGHVANGLQIDGSYAYMHDRSNVLLAALRGIYFYPRYAVSKDPCISPLYPCQKYKIKPGGLFDVYIAHQTNWQKKNRFEFGYTASFIGAGSDIIPTIPNIGGSDLFIRHTFFNAYFRRIPIKTVQTGLVAGFSGGFDSRPKLLGNKYQFNVWFVYGLLF